ncbi:MAG: hypothetical protein NVSMB62_25370 [Acidobacteriaceae bacterium]
MMRTLSVARNVVTFALLLGAAAFTSTSAFALPHFGVHRHPAETNDGRVSVVIFNAGGSFRDVKIAEHVYTVMSHQALRVKAPEGTAVYTDSTGALHHKGDLLFAVSRTMQDKTVTIN